MAALIAHPHGLCYPTDHDLPLFGQLSLQQREYIDSRSCGKARLVLAIIN
jgi:hypothetical protein